MNCNPDIKRVECWMCQRNPYVQRVPLTVAGGNPSPGHPVPLKIDRDECEVIAALGGIAGEPGLADLQMILQARNAHRRHSYRKRIKCLHFNALTITNLVESPCLFW